MTFIHLLNLLVIEKKKRIKGLMKCTYQYINLNPLIGVQCEQSNIVRGLFNSKTFRRRRAFFVELIPVSINIKT